ncbi:MAG TPA: amidohydrolase [Thermomicrobiales bacterium]|nr:amidohydrolase [Thermomicrobiales bacterium]
MPPTPSLAIVGARIRTLDPARPEATAVAIRDGQILHVGDDRSVRELSAATTEIVDGAGLHLVPGLTDCHIHPFMGAIRTLGADLTAARSLNDVRSAMATERDKVGPDGWVRGWGCSYEPWDGAGLRGDLFDDAVAGQPAFIGIMDGHTAVANGAALAIAGIDGPRRFEEAAEIVCDPDGRPTGELREWAAIGLVQTAMPQLCDDERYALFVETFRRFNRLGLTSLHAMDGSPADLATLRRMEANGDLSCRVVQPMWVKPEMGRDEWEPLLAQKAERGRRWRGGVAKFFIDGVIDTGTGWLIEPDTHGDGRLPFWPDPAFYTEAVARFARAGFQCVTHAVGDMAVRHALDAYKAAGAAPRVHHRVEHIELVDDAELPRFAAEGVVASMQPLHMQWFHPAWAERVGPERAAKAGRARSILDTGATLALGSDWMVATEDPRIGMAWARLRRPGGAPEWEPVTPGEALTPLQVLEGYTTAAAFTVGEEAFSGRIAPGFRADLTAFAGDPVACAADALPGLPVLLTMVDGEIVHREEA